MVEHGAFKRLSLIIGKVMGDDFPSKKIIGDYLESEGLEISERTLDRYIEQLRHEYGVELGYNKEKNGYCIDREKSLNIDAFLKYLEMAETSELIGESLKQDKTALSHLYFDSEQNLKGVEHLGKLLYAVKNRLIVEFDFQKFIHGEAGSQVIEPLLLKQYHDLWYLIGKKHHSEKIKSYRIDRILHLKVTETTYISEKTEYAFPNLDCMIGWNYSENPAEEIVLSFSPEQAHLIKLKPFHRSQEIVKENENELRIKVKLIPNYELEQHILMHGERVHVIKPKWLADKIMKRLKKARKNYKG
jgi:predicted DNA-binding transcriptional regulator YafY